MALHLIRHARLLTLAATAAAMLLVPAGAAAATQGCVDDVSGVTDLGASWEADLLAATNAHRTSQGLVALQLDATLTRASAWKARDMARRSYFSHDDPANGAAPARTPWERLEACGWSSGGSRAENIAAGYATAAATVAGWIDSPGHRANIEDASMRYVGFGVASSSSSAYGRYQVQMFASVAGPAGSTPTTTSPAPAAPTVRALELVADTTAARYLCPAAGTSYVVESLSGSVEVVTAADGCLALRPTAGAVAGDVGTVRYLARAPGGASSPAVELAVVLVDQARTVLEQADPTSRVATQLPARSGVVTRVRCRGPFAVGGWCYRLTVRGRALLGDRSAASGRDVVVARRLSNGRLLVTARMRTRADGSFATTVRLRPPARGTVTWLQRNATRLRIGVAPTAAAAPAVAWTAAPLRLRR